MAERPIEPSGPDWPFIRAFEDGAASAHRATLSWLLAMTTPTPDGAQNTED